MAALKKHWRGILLTTILFVATLVWVVLANGRSGAVGAAGENPDAEGAEMLAAPDYCAIRSLREDLHLADTDLAAMGCTEETARNVLEGLKAWYLANKAQLQQLERNLADSRRALRDAMRRIHAGPPDGGLAAQLPGLKSNVTRAEGNLTGFIEGVIPTMEPKLSWSQCSVWATLRSTVPDSGDYRYASNLTAGQVRDLRLARRALARRRIQASSAQEHSQIAADFRAREQEVLSYAQQNALSAARENVRRHMAAVLKASEEILPLPEELEPTEPPEEATHP